MSRILIASGVPLDAIAVPVTDAIVPPVAPHISECAIDEQIEQSFPASDPPGWTMGTT